MSLRPKGTWSHVLLARAPYFLLARAMPPPSEPVLGVGVRSFISRAVAVDPRQAQD